MKAFIQIVLVLATTFFTFNFSFTQAEPTDMPGDNFSLEGALSLFQKSNSPEHFEELLNKKDNNVNNLDLDDDGYIDYIRVIDNKEKNAHALVLQVPISKKEQQDIAVIVIEKTSDKYAELQIIGDEDIIGEELVVEPLDIEGTNDSRGGPNDSYQLNRIVVNVWLWPSVRYIYTPTYRPYISPWHWGYYPRGWKTWRPLSWGIFSSKTAHFRVGVRIAPVVRVKTARAIYRPRRTTSVTVVKRYSVKKKAYVKRSNKVIKKRPNKTVAAGNNKNTVIKKSRTRAITKDGNRKAKVDKTSKKTIATKGNEKAVFNRSTSKTIGTNGKTKKVSKKKTKSIKTKTKKGVKVKNTKTKVLKKKKKKL